MADLTAAEKATHRINFGDMASRIKNGTDMDFEAGSDYAAAIIWASERIAELEETLPMPEASDDENRELFFRLGSGCGGYSITYCTAIAWGQTRIRQLELENENLSNSPPVEDPESGEETHQRRRREQMLDEVTLTLIADGLREMNCTINEFGNGIRQSAIKLCDGINEADSKH